MNSYILLTHIFSFATLALGALAVWRELRRKELPPWVQVPVMAALCVAAAKANPSNSQKNAESANQTQITRSQNGRDSGKANKSVVQGIDNASTPFRGISRENWLRWTHSEAYGWEGDPDSDGLDGEAEYFHGTDPCSNTTPAPSRCRTATSRGSDETLACRRTTTPL